jgi:hypothetical protein
MKSERPGKNTSDVEVTHISKSGIWILIKGIEHFLSFKEFPWFRKATIDEVHTVELNHAQHIRWPLIDVDLTIDRIEHPQNYPLVSKPRS